MIPKIIKNTVKGIGTISKLGVEITSEAVGAISDNIKNSSIVVDKGWSNGTSNDREKFSKLGKEIGESIRYGTDKFANKSEELAEVGVEAIKIVREHAKEKIDVVKQQKLQKDIEKFSKSSEAKVIDAEYTERK